MAGLLFDKLFTGKIIHTPKLYIMKKLIAILSIIILSVGQMSARDKVYRNADPLPPAAKTMLKTFFPKLNINRVKVDKKVLGKAEYEVILNDGTEIEFNNDGDWTEVDCGHRAIPQNIIMKSIRDYVSKNYKGKSIVKIDKGTRDYEIELSNGIELKFDRAGNFQRIDD